MTVNFICISPSFPPTNANFCRHLSAAGVRVLGIGDTPYPELPSELVASLSEYYRVGSLESYDAVLKAVGFLTFKHGKIDWLESNNEYWLDLDARLRTDFNITTGHGVERIDAIRSKSAMKPVYASAGIPTARQRRVGGVDDVLDFARMVGYPLVAKPEFGIGATGAYRLDGDDQVRAHFASRTDRRYVVEEFVAGDLISYDAIVNDAGDPVFEAATLWPPSIMDVVTSRLDLAYRVLAEVPEGLAEVGRRASRAFGMRNRFVHEEFFRLHHDRPGLGRKGDFVGLEVNMRPAGGFTLDMYDYARGADVYQIYTDLVTGHDSGAAERARRDPRIAAFASRRDEFDYRMPWSEVLAKYGDEIVATRRNPELFVPQMGNQFAILRTRSSLVADEFSADVTARA